MSSKNINIMGIRGIPAAHGGFETFAEHFSIFLRENDWSVTVYCQGPEASNAPKRVTDSWNGINRVHISTRTSGALATVEFDLRCTLDVLRRPGVDLILGYNTALFVAFQRVFGRKILMNMDGIEWKRRKWGKGARLWFWINEWLGARLSNHLIADHPCIAEHLASRSGRSSSVIPYGAHSITDAPLEPLGEFDLSPKGYFISIARIEPENSILEMVKAFVDADIDAKFVVLGRLDFEFNGYHKSIKSAASDRVLFPGAIYDQSTLRALRFHCLAYMHGHQVGGTNPSLVEALGAGNPVIAHDNIFNRWTAGVNQLYFHDVNSCSECIREIYEASQLRVDMAKASIERHKSEFTFHIVHGGYLKALIQLERGYYL